MHRLRFIATAIFFCAVTSSAVLPGGRSRAEPASREAACTALPAGPTRTVTEIIDGETLKLDDGVELRLIGALAPRALDVGSDPGVWEPENRTREALRSLILGKSIELHFAGERSDRYGRLLAHAFLIEGNTRRWVQGFLLEQGLARAYALAGNRACDRDLVGAESAARDARTGLWAEAAYQVRSGRRPRELLRYRTTFQVVEGTIARVALVRGVIYLNFDRNWRRGFSASVRQNDRAMLGEYASNLKALEGSTIRVRGWMGQRGNAPLIDLSVGGYIEILAGRDQSELRQSP